MAIYENSWFFGLKVADIAVSLGNHLWGNHWMAGGSHAHHHLHQVRTENINNECRHLPVYTNLFLYSDQPFHIGGDGMLGGVWRPNPGTCQLTRSFNLLLYWKNPTLFCCRLPVLGKKNPPLYKCLDWQYCQFMNIVGKDDRADKDSSEYGRTRT